MMKTPDYSNLSVEEILNMLGIPNYASMNPREKLENKEIIVAFLLDTIQSMNFREYGDKENGGNITTNFVRT